MRFGRDNQHDEKINIISEYAKCIFLNIIVGVYPVVFLYLQNIKETNFREYNKLFIVFGLVGLASYFIFKIIVRCNYKAAVMAVLFNCFILNGIT